MSWVPEHGGWESLRDTLAYERKGELVSSPGTVRRVADWGVLCAFMPAMAGTNRTTLGESGKNPGYRG